MCPVSSALEVVGDKWTMLGLMIQGPCPYSEFRESPEHIAANILAQAQPAFQPEINRIHKPSVRSSQQRCSSHREQRGAAARTRSTRQVGTNPPQGVARIYDLSLTLLMRAADLDAELIPELEFDQTLGC